MSTSIKVEVDSYILKEVDSEEGNSAKVEFLIGVLFCISAIPSSYSMQDTLWLEMPWFEISQPEGITLSSWLLLMQSISFVLNFGLLWTETYVVTFPKMGFLYCASFTTLLVSFVLSLTWHYSINGLSLFLYLGSFVGQFIGTAQYIFVVPWIADNYDASLISPFLSGDALMLFIMVSIQIVQEPGGECNFSPAVYFILAGTIYAITFGVCVCTFTCGIGRRIPTDAVQPLRPWRKSLWIQTFPSEFWDIKFYTFGRVWMDQLTWTAVPLALPYAARSTTHSYTNNGQSFLQWSVALGYLMFLSGSLFSSVPTKKYWLKEALALNTIANGVILLAAENIGEWSTWTMKVSLMTAVAVSRFSWGWFFPLCLRELVCRFPERRELLVRSNSLWYLYSSVVCRILISVSV